MKIIVYTISKNEAQHVDRFMASCKGADGVYVLDTSSTCEEGRKPRYAMGAGMGRPRVLEV